MIEISGCIEVPDKEPEMFCFRPRPFPNDAIDYKALEVNGVDMAAFEEITR